MKLLGQLFINGSNFCANRRISTAAMKGKRLAAWDFDHTVVAENTDIVARNLISSSLIPQEVKDLYKSTGWIAYMQAIFHLLHNNGVFKNTLLEAIRTIPEVDGIQKCFQQLKSSNYDHIIISDSNSVFIDTWSRGRILDYVDRIYTNPAEFGPDNRLLIQPYHHQTECRLSSENLCKGAILDNFLREQRQNGVLYDSVFFIGDGRNDICPMLRLGERDFACPRNGYACERELEAIAKKINAPIKANVFRWNDGDDLLEFMNSKAT